MITKEPIHQNMATCVYVVDGDEFGGYRSSGTVFAWHGKCPVSIGDEVLTEFDYPSNISGGKVLSVFKIHAEDAKKMLKAYSSLDEMREAGWIVV